MNLASPSQHNISSLFPQSVRPKPLTGSSDFLSFYGLRENPFGDSVNPEFYYRTAAHDEALGKMRMTVEHKISLGMVTAPSGMGKTLLTQLLLDELDEEKNTVILLLVTPGLSKTGLLREILSELSVAQPAGVTRTEDLVKLLSNSIIELHEEGRRLVIIVDECHLLSSDCLHIIRTISNLEIPSGKLATCLLFGEERFARRLQNPSYDSLRNRMFFKTGIAPMTLEEIGQYIQYRLLTVGRMTALFTPGAIALLHERSGGVCRNLNKFCFLTLIEGARRGEEMIEAEVVESATRSV